jgi:hypothetical protein
MEKVELDNYYLTDKINIILRQTDYTIEEATAKLKEKNNNYIEVIKDYLGITEKKALPSQKSLNQQIFTHLRGELDHCMREYNERKK